MSHRRLTRQLLKLLLRVDRPADVLARGVSFGLLVGLTPTVGIQLPTLVVIWMLVRKAAPRWSFDLLAAFASSCVTNPVTAPVFYYVFVVTGRLMLGRWGGLLGFDAFHDKLRASLDPEAGWIETAWTYFSSAIGEYGLPMMIGCLPWALLASWLGYRWSLRLIVRYRARRELRAQRRLVGP